MMENICVFFSSRRRHTRFDCDWSSDVCSSDSVSSFDLPEKRFPTWTSKQSNGSCPSGHCSNGCCCCGSEGKFDEIGRASCWGRGEISGGAGSFKKKKE